MGDTIERVCSKGEIVLVRRLQRCLICCIMGQRQRVPSLSPSLLPSPLSFRNVLHSTNSSQKLPLRNIQITKNKMPCKESNVKLEPWGSVYSKINRQPERKWKDLIALSCYNHTHTHSDT